MILLVYINIISNPISHRKTHLPKNPQKNLGSPCFQVVLTNTKLLYKLTTVFPPSNNCVKIVLTALLSSLTIYNKLCNFCKGFKGDVFKASAIERTTRLLTQICSYTYSRWLTWFHCCLLLMNGMALFCILCSLDLTQTLTTWQQPKLLLYGI